MGLFTLGVVVFSLISNNKIMDKNKKPPTMTMATDSNFMSTNGAKSTHAIWANSI